MEGFVKLGWHLLLALPASAASGHGWVYLTVVALGALVLEGSWSESSSESSASYMVSTSGRMMAGFFSRWKPTALSHLELMVSEELL